MENEVNYHIVRYTIICILVMVAAIVYWFAVPRNNTWIVAAFSGVFLIDRFIAYRAKEKYTLRWQIIVGLVRWGLVFTSGIILITYNPYTGRLFFGILMASIGGIFLIERIVAYIIQGKYPLKWNSYRRIGKKTVWSIVGLITLAVLVWLIVILVQLGSGPIY